MNSETVKRFVITRGLPGSGKTTLLTRLHDTDIKNEKYAIYVNADCYMKQGYSTAIPEAWRFAYYNLHHDDRLWNPDNDDTTIYIDALCTSTEAVAGLIEAVISYFNECRGWTNYDFTIYDFNEDRENCLRNNEFRAKINPSRSAALTIKRAEYDKLDNDKLISIVADYTADESRPITVTTHIIPATVWKYEDSSPVERIRANIMDAASMCGGILKNGVLYGESWVIGGREWNYTGTEWPVTPDEGREFEEFDRLLEFVCPDISFLNYKKIKNEICKHNEFHESDYYSSYEKMQWMVSIEDIVNVLVKYKIID